MKKIFLAFTMGSLCAVSWAQGEELKVAIDPRYPPLIFKTADGKLTGFDFDIANALCEEIKRKCVFVEQDWSGMIPNLLAKKYDAIICTMSITEDRLKVVDFSDKYYQTPRRIMLKDPSKKELNYTNPASIKGKKIGVLKASTQEKYAMGELKPAGVEVIVYDLQEQIYLDIKAGRLDGTVARLEVISDFLNKHSADGYQLVGPALFIPKYFGTGVGVTLRKGQGPLKEQINAAIKTLRANGKYKAINDKYFKFDAYGI
jgi:arginine/ornithine transport system substrate-binding protein